MLRSVVKIVVFLLITASFVIMLKMRTINSDNAAINTLATLPDTDTAFFFIGSSRVQKSIDPAIINNHYKDLRVFNLGISSGNFLSNCVVADFIIQQHGHKVLFIELALILNELPEGLFNLSSQTGLNLSHSVRTLTNSQSISERSMLISQIINHQLFKSINVGDQVRGMIGYKVNSDNDKWIGFDPYDKNESHNSNSFLTWDEINTGKSMSIDLTKHKAMINYLENLAKNNNARLVFFLPITYSDQLEKSIVIPLYHTLPDSMKLNFSDDFLKQIRRSEYLGDENHLNRKGATAYSRLIIPLLD